MPLVVEFSSISNASYRVKNLNLRKNWLCLAGFDSLICNVAGFSCKEYSNKKNIYMPSFAVLKSQMSETDMAVVKPEVCRIALSYFLCMFTQLITYINHCDIFCLIEDISIFKLLFLHLLYVLLALGVTKAIVW